MRTNNRTKEDLEEAKRAIAWQIGDILMERALEKGRFDSAINLINPSVLDSDCLRISGKFNLLEAIKRIESANYS